MKNIIVICCVLILNLSLKAQTNNDSILANERKIDRPLTLHKGQFQVNTAYKMSILSKEYDNEGNKLDLAKNGTAGVLHSYMVELNYGILDFLQASVAMNYSKRGERKENYYLGTDPPTSISYFNDYKGFDDLYFGAIFKLPLRTHKFEFAISPGIYIPVFSNEPKQPEHTITYPTPDQSFTQIYYHYNYPMAKGALALKIGASTIFRVGTNFSISAFCNYSGPVSESESIYWVHQLNVVDFEYTKIPYNYLISNSIDYKLDIAYQAISWFNMSFSYQGIKNMKGWSEQTGTRIENPETSLSLVAINYELKITGKLWLDQIIAFPVSGKNQLAPLSIYTGIRYNLFPFNRKSNIISIEEEL